LVFLFLVSQSVNAQSDLVIKVGETDTIEASVHKYRNITINGSLVITESKPNSWCVLWASGRVQINGVITARRFLNGPRTASLNLPDGRVVSHSYRNEMIGGDGGNGGTSKIIQGIGKFKNATYKTDSATGGAGGLGGMNFGGGGGSGGGIHILGSSTRIGSNGAPGIDWIGGEQPDGGYGNNGGNGGVLRESSNGGLVVIYAAKGIEGCKGIIDLRGENGMRGFAGGDGSISQRGMRGAGGGGGGSPGGEGGKIILIVDEPYECLPKIMIEGGLGGEPGNPGRSYGQVDKPATKGKRGENGLSGQIEIYTLKQWLKDR
jgi:hypothetical protein